MYRSCNFSFVKYKGNYVTHVLDKFVLLIDKDVIWLKSHPRVLEDVMSFDVFQLFNQ